MSLNIHPLKLHDSAMNMVDRANRSQSNFLVKGVKIAGSNVTAAVTGVASTIFEAGKSSAQLVGAFAKYAAIGTVRVITVDYFKAPKTAFNALPGFKDCGTSAMNTLKQGLGVLTSLSGVLIVGSKFNATTQHKLGNVKVVQFARQEACNKLDKKIEENKETFFDEYRFASLDKHMAKASTEKKKLLGPASVVSTYLDVVTTKKKVETEPTLQNRNITFVFDLEAKMPATLTIETELQQRRAAKKLAEEAAKKLAEEAAATPQPQPEPQPAPQPTEGQTTGAPVVNQSTWRDYIPAAVIALPLAIIVGAGFARR